MSAREAGETTVTHENADEVCCSRGVLSPFSRPRFLFRFTPPLLGCFRIRVSMSIIFSGRIRLLKLPAPHLLPHPTLCNFLARLEPYHHRREPPLLMAWYLKPFRTKLYCILERQTHRSICHFGRRDEDWWRREREQECSVGRPEECGRGWRKVKLICLKYTAQPSNASVFVYIMRFTFLCGVGVDLPFSSPCGT